MSKYSTQFDESTQTIGTNLAGWTVRGGGTPTYAPAYGDPAVVAVKRRYLPFINDNTSDYHCISQDVIDADANKATFNRVGCLLVDQTNQEEWHIYARGQGTATVTDFIRARIVKASGVIAIDKMVASVYTAGSGASAGTTTLTAGHCYFYRFAGAAGNVSLKIWDANLGHDDSAIAYNLTPTGLTPTAAGWHGLGGRHSTLTGKTAAFNFEAVGTNGDSAVCFRTNTEYTAYLGKKVLPGETGVRCVTAEMLATGYDSTGSPYTKTVKVYLSNYGYTSQQQDTPSNRHFDNYIQSIPTFSREMGVALSGQASVGFGDLIISNPAGQGIPTAPALEFLQTHAGGSAYTYWQISAPAYVIPTGARLKYDFFVDPNNPVILWGGGGIEIDTNGTAPNNNGRSASLADTLGDISFEYYSSHKCS